MPQKTQEKPERTLTSEISEKDDGKSVLVEGWVHETRDLSKIRFLVLRDMSGIIQITAIKGKTPEGVFDMIAKIPRESAVSVEGKVKQSKQAPQGREILPEKIEIISEAESVLPIDVSDFSKTELPKRLDYRYLDLHNARTQAIFRIQSEISTSFGEFFKNEKFMEIQPPSVIGSSSEGGTELFPVMYFEKPAFLAQSPQLYKQMAACSLERVFCITPVWRAEKHNTVRHLNESRQMDIEMAFADEFKVMDLLAKSVQHIVSNVKEKCRNELAKLGIKIEIPKEKYLSYDEAVELLKKQKIKIEKGDDLPPEAEKKLAELFPDTIVFIHDWPRELKPFYIMPKTLNEKEKTSKGFDAIYGGMEISSGGQRVHIPKLLESQIKAKGLNAKNFESYINSFRYGAPEHAGWSIGLERFTMALLKLDNIREACLFPRDRDRLTP
ncbi:MAG: aspartate--tRNA(Asn) ligase [archaeon]